MALATEYQGRETSGRGGVCDKLDTDSTLQLQRRTATRGRGPGVARSIRKSQRVKAAKSGRF